MFPMCGRMVAINLKKLATLEGKGRTVRDLVKTYIDRYNLAPTQQAVTVHLARMDGLGAGRTHGTAGYGLITLTT